MTTPMRSSVREDTVFGNEVRRTLYPRRCINTSSAALTPGIHTNTFYTYMCRFSDTPIVLTVTTARSLLRSGQKGAIYSAADGLGEVWKIDTLCVYVWSVFIIISTRIWVWSMRPLIWWSCSLGAAHYFGRDVHICVWWEYGGREALSVYFNCF